MEQVSVNWETCGTMLEDMNLFDVACMATINSCSDIASNSQFKPIAEYCLPKCSDDLGINSTQTCEPTFLGSLLQDPAICGENSPPFYKYGTAQIPWGVLTGLLYSLLVVFCDPSNIIGKFIITNIRAGGGCHGPSSPHWAKEGDRLKLPTIVDILGANIQALLRERASGQPYKFEHH